MEFVPSLASLYTIEDIVRNGFRLIKDDGWIRHYKKKKSLCEEAGLYGGVLWRAAGYCNNSDMQSKKCGDPVGDQYVFVIAILAAKDDTRSVKINTGEVFLADQPYIVGLVVYVQSTPTWDVPEMHNIAGMEGHLESLRTSKTCQLYVKPEVCKCNFLHLIHLPSPKINCSCLEQFSAGGGGCQPPQCAKSPKSHLARMFQNDFFTCVFQTTVRK